MGAVFLLVSMLAFESLAIMLPIKREVATLASAIGYATFAARLR